MDAKRFTMLFLLAASTSLLGCADEGLPEEVSAGSPSEEEADGVELQLEPYLQQQPGDGDPGDPPGPDPDTLRPKAATARPISRTVSSITAQWAASLRADSASVQRRLGTGTGWTTVRSNAAGAGSYTDTGLAEDTIYCYRIRALNENGANTSVEKCALTGKTGSPGVFRAQLRLRIADVEDAGSDDKLGVSLNYNALGYNFTGVSYSHDDFERNSDFTYDLDLGSIGKLHDIANIRISKYGSDAICVRGFTLLVNGVAAYTRTYGNTSSTCHWVDSDDGHTNTINVTHAELRAAPSFASFQSPFPSLFVPKEEMVSRVESLIGNLLWNNDKIQWGHIYGGAGVETSKGSGTNRLHVDLDLESVINNFPNPEVDIDFDMVVSFFNDGSSWALSFDVQNIVVAVDFSWWVEVIGAIGAPVCGIITGNDCVTLIENHIESKVEAGFSGPSQRIPLGSLPCNPPTAVVTEQGGLMFGCSF